MISRRTFCLLAGYSVATASDRVPVRLIWDKRAALPPEKQRRFRQKIWQQAVRDFERAGIEFAVVEADGEIRRSPADRPIFLGLDRGAINVVVTNRIPIAWDQGRGLQGVSTGEGGYHLCVIALDSAHAHRIPLVAVNTCVHELLHIFLEDLAEPHRGVRREAHELRVDWYATRLWLFRDGGDLRDRVRAFLSQWRALATMRPLPHGEPSNESVDWGRRVEWIRSRAFGAEARRNAPGC